MGKKMQDEIVESSKIEKSDLSKKIQLINSKLQSKKIEQIQIIDSFSQEANGQEKQQIIDIQQSAYFTPVYQHRNYKSHIKPVLQKFKNRKPYELNLEEVVKAIIYFRQQFLIHRQNRLMIKKNTKDRGFQIILNFHSQLAKQVFSKAIKFILDNESDKSMYQIPIFEANQQLCQNLTKWQVLFIMCCMALCLIVEQKFDTTQKIYRFTHFIEFSQYFTSNQWKTRCILEYLKTQLTNYYEPKPNSMNNRILTIKRVICPVKVQKLMKKDGHKLMKNVNIPNDDVTVDDTYGELKLCHTNDFIGGGQTLGGLSQQDIFFSAHTQLHVLLVLCEQMNISDCFNLIGFRKYFRIERTKYEIVFDGQDNDYPLQLDVENRIKDYICFVNHPKLMRQHFRQQFKKQPVDREIAIYYGAIKSFQDMPNVYFRKVVTGHWATTIQWGDPRKKLTTIWIACSMTDNQLTFCPYGQFKVVYEKNFLGSTMKSKQAIDMYQYLLAAGKKMMSFRDNLHVYMLHQSNSDSK